MDGLALRVIHWRLHLQGASRRVQFRPNQSIGQRFPPNVSGKRDCSRNVYAAFWQETPSHIRGKRNGHLVMQLIDLSVGEFACRAHLEQQWSRREPKFHWFVHRAQRNHFLA